VTHTETIRLVHGVSDASWHRLRGELRFTGARRNADRLRREEYRRLREGFAYEDCVADPYCGGPYYLPELRVINALGLTDGFLARTDARADRPAHHFVLVRMADDLVDVYRATPKPGPGMFRRAVEEGRAAGWIGENLSTIEAIERKVFNTHEFGANVRSAVTFPGRIRVPAEYYEEAASGEELEG
jgi:hypothetical protein